MAALLGGQVDVAWVRLGAPDQRGLGLPHGRHRPGLWWAYYELGWGGWWFWDPVENASFMPHWPAPR